MCMHTAVKQFNRDFQSHLTEIFSVREENKSKFSTTDHNNLQQDKAGEPAQLVEASIPTRLVKCFEFNRCLKPLSGTQTSCFSTRSPFCLPDGIFNFQLKNLTQKVKVTHVQGRFQK